MSAHKKFTSKISKRMIHVQTNWPSSSQTSDMCTGWEHLQSTYIIKTGCKFQTIYQVECWKYMWMTFYYCQLMQVTAMAEFSKWLREGIRIKHTYHLASKWGYFPLGRLSLTKFSWMIGFPFPKQSKNLHPSLRQVKIFFIVLEEENPVL